MTHDVPQLGALADDAIELRLIRVLEAGDLGTRPPAGQFLAGARRNTVSPSIDGVTGREWGDYLRVTGNEEIVEAVGHMGYEVDEGHRRKGYAVRAIRLIVGLARQYGVAPLWVLIEPDNLASRRAVERAGFHQVDEIDTKAAAAALGVGPRVCRDAIERP